MSKGIIIVDIPQLDCRECQCFNKTYSSCGAVHKFIDPIIGKIPDFCPIKPIPMEKDMHDGKYLIQAARDEGWNDCLDEILKEE